MEEIEVIYHNILDLGLNNIIIACSSLRIDLANYIPFADCTQLGTHSSISTNLKITPRVARLSLYQHTPPLFAPPHCSVRARQYQLQAELGL
ncbi:hypothetical protein Csa_006462 [Cucumis sativus]|nr:hypothetical protein Csa_006462 [Cucumis sativus]